MVVSTQDATLTGGRLGHHGRGRNCSRIKRRDDGSVGLPPTPDQPLSPRVVGRYNTRDLWAKTVDVGSCDQYNVIVSCVYRDIDAINVALYGSDMSGVAVLVRGRRVLDLLIELESDPVRRGKGLSVQQVALGLDIHKSTASRLTQTLVATGYTVPIAGSRRGFRLGPAVQTHWPLTSDQRRPGDMVHLYLLRLVEETGECAHTALPSGTSALVIEDAVTDQALRVVAGKGRRIPLHCTSAGKCLLAFGLMPTPPKMPARTPRTITSRHILEAHLAEITQRGYALDDEENHPGVRCISAPVFNGLGGEPIGCVGINGPTLRMIDTALEDLVRRVVAVARDLSNELGRTARQLDQLTC